MICSLQFEAGGDLNAAADGAGDWAAVGVEPQHPLDRGPLRLVGGQPVGDMDALDHQHLGVQLDLADCLAPQTTACGGNASRFKRSSERAGQSASGHGDRAGPGG